MNDTTYFTYVTIHDSICIQLTATHCNTRQHTATHCNTLQHIATHCNTLQHTATHCNSLQHTATHCNTLQHRRVLGGAQALQRARNLTGLSTFC